MSGRMEGGGCEWVGGERRAECEWVGGRTRVGVGRRREQGGKGWEEGAGCEWVGGGTRV